jgi:hypothetical protein
MAALYPGRMPLRGKASRKLVNTADRAVHSPGWLRETVRGKMRARADRNRHFSLADHSEHLCDVAEALGGAFGVSADEYRSLTSRLRIPSAPEGSVWAGGEDILNLTGSVVHLRCPSVVVETGVARGFDHGRHPRRDG